MEYPPIKLPDNPRDALAEVASYLRTVDTTSDRAVPDPETPGETLGYWQTADWFSGLAENEAECRRVSLLSPDNDPTKLEQVLKLLGPFIQHDSGCAALQPMWHKGSCDCHFAETIRHLKEEFGVEIVDRANLPADAEQEA